MKTVLISCGIDIMKFNDGQGTSQKWSHTNNLIVVQTMDKYMVSYRQFISSLKMVVFNLDNIHRKGYTYRAVRQTYCLPVRGRAASLLSSRTTSHCKMYSYFIFILQMSLKIYLNFLYHGSVIYSYNTWQIITTIYVKIIWPLSDVLLWN